MKMLLKDASYSDDIATASVAEVVEALNRLTKAALLRLKRIGQLRAAGLSGTGWDDLLNEAICRALSGDRRWPKGVPFVAFLAQTMRSIASEERRRIRTQPSSTGTKEASDDSRGVAQEAAEDLTPERLLLAKDAIRRIEALFADDPLALEVLNGLALGLEPDEIMERTGSTKTQYASAQRRIRRQLVRRHDLMETIHE